MRISHSLHNRWPQVPGVKIIENWKIHEIVVGLLCAIVAGCSGGPSALKPPSLDPGSAAAKAMTLFDKDGNGYLSLEELKACPGMLASINIYDQNGDQKISAEEIVQRLEKFVKRGVALSRLSATVRLDKRPLADATIRFLPESYLGDAIKPAVGKTRRMGSATMAVADEDLPMNQRGIRGIHTGTYRVEITHPKIEIPAKYNTETTLGYETTPGNPYVTFDLKSR